MHLYMQVLLTVPFAVFANGCLFFLRNKSCVKILSSGEYKKCLFLETEDSVFVF